MEELLDVGARRSVPGRARVVAAVLIGCAIIVPGAVAVQPGVLDGRGSHEFSGTVTTPHSYQPLRGHHLY